MISIILPVYQVENYIKNCIISISNQSYKDFEVILVNDGTKDHSIKEATSILKEKNIIYKVINQKNSGVSVARNNGIKAANREWVVCVDPDDILNENFLKSLLEANLTMNTDVALSSYQMVDGYNLFKIPSSTTRVKKIPQKELLHLFLMREIKIISPAILVRRKLLVQQNIFYEESMRFSEDVHWIWRLLLKVDNASYVTSELYNYNLRPHSTMTSSDIEKIVTGYSGFNELNMELQDTNHKNLKKHLFNRWILGVINTSARLLSYKDFNIFLNKINYKKHLSKLLKFPDARVFLLALLLLSSKKLFYILLNKI